MGSEADAHFKHVCKREKHRCLQKHHNASKATEILSQSFTKELLGKPKKGICLSFTQVDPLV